VKGPGSIAGVIALIAIAVTPATASAGDGASCAGVAATIVGTGGNDELEGTPGPDVIVGLAGDDELSGLGQADLLCGGPGADTILGGAGDDGMWGQGGNDEMRPGTADFANFPVVGGGGDDRLLGRAGPWFNVFSYIDSPRGVTIDLAAGTARGWGRDTLVHFADGDGSMFDDVILGDDGPNGLFGAGGNDVIRARGNPPFAADFVSGDAPGDGDDRLSGGPGYDIVDYEVAEAGVRVNLETGLASGGSGRDHVDGFEAIFGSWAFGDVLVGDAGDNSFHGYGGDDVIRGGPGRDLVTFHRGPAGVTADLRTGVATGDGEDTLVSVEDMIGTVYDDHLTGRSGRNTLIGLEGDDRLFGRAGDDGLFGDGDGFPFPEVSDDVLRGGHGRDVCLHGEVLAGCEETSRPSGIQLNRLLAEGVEHAAVRRRP
jgi:Ca2+-binding RTX toxin-like protein